MEPITVGTDDTWTYNPTGPTRHRHTYKGQSLVHSHADGNNPHGYYQHAEDGAQIGAYAVVLSLGMPDITPDGPRFVGEQPCGATNKDGLSCTLPAEHDGLLDWPHVAGNGEIVVGIWPVA